jgi:hypothetical protein
MDESIVNFYKGNVKKSTIGSIGGSGGYTAGILIVPKETVFYIRLGGYGEIKMGNGISNSIETENDDIRPKGGYNGGGSGTSDGGTGSTDEASGGGGGATHIATVSGVLSTLFPSTYSIYVVGTFSLLINIIN